MNNNLKNSLWKQFGASIDMFKNAVQMCPEEFLNSGKKQFYMVYHTVLFLDYYMTIPPNGFKAQLPFTIKSQNEIPPEAIDDIIPDRIYTKKELLEYLKFTRNKCRKLIAGLTDEKLNERWINEPDDLAASVTMNYSVFEILLYNLRHVQHHTAQLNLILRQEINAVPDWVSQAEEDFY